MTIDEVIKICKDITNYEQPCPGYCMTRTCDKCEQEREQLAEWLEELKELRTTSFGYRKEDIELNRNAMYNKAIDDLLGGMNQITYNCQDADELFEKICDLAEQLKVG